jgi:hypothetical protein
MDPNAIHSLKLQRWDNGAFLPTPVVLRSQAGLSFNPSITARASVVAIAAHGQSPGCMGDLGLQEIEVDMATQLPISNQFIDSTCKTVGHSHLIYSAAADAYHACWTKKLNTSDEVMCASRPIASVWSPAVNINGAGLAFDQDHATVGIASDGTARIAFHNRVGLGIDDDEAPIYMYNADGTHTAVALPGGGAPEPGNQNRPFLAVSDDQLHVAWEDGPNASERIKYARCAAGSPSGCDAASEWTYENVEISEPGFRARYPHLAIGQRTWISYEQRLSANLNEVNVLHRCSNAAVGTSWTIDDPDPTDAVDEMTEELGTPHIAIRAIAPLPGTLQSRTAPTYVVGTVAMTKTANEFDAVLYEKVEPGCP